MHPMNVLSNVSNTITSLKLSEENELLHVIMYGGKSFDSNTNRDTMGAKSLIATAVTKVYSPQPSNISDTLNDSTKHFLSNSINNPR